MNAIERSVDELGRIVLPIEFRENLGIQEKDVLSMSLGRGKITVEKKAPACSGCGKPTEELTNVGRLNLCAECIAAIQAL